MKKKGLSSHQLTLSGLVPPPVISLAVEKPNRFREKELPEGVKRKLAREAKEGTFSPATDGSCPQGRYSRMDEIVKARKARVEGRSE
jgi:hypothetical protein